MELKDRKEKIKLLHKPIMSKYDIDKFEEQEMNKKDQLQEIGFIRKQNVIGKKPKIIRDNLKDKIIKDIWTFFETTKEIIKDNLIRNTRKLFEQES